MKYIKTYERNIKYLFSKGEYVKKFNELEDENDQSFYQIINRRKKAQGWLSDTNQYVIKCVYKNNYHKNFQNELNERRLRKLTPEEQEEIDTILAAKKYNL